jgi:hypothetical protein
MTAEVAQSVWCLAGRPRFDSRQGQDFSLLLSVQTGSEAHPATYQGALSPRGKRSGREADHSPLSNAVVNGAAISPLPYASMAQGQLYSYLSIYGAAKVLGKRAGHG